MLAIRKRCWAAARASYQRCHEQKTQVVEGAMGRGAWVVQLPRSTWRFPSPLPTTALASPFSRPMLLLPMRGAKRGSARPTTNKPEKPGQQHRKQRPEAKSTSDLFVRWEIPWDGKRVVITLTAIAVSSIFTGLASWILFHGFDFTIRPPRNSDEIPLFFFTNIVLQALVGIFVMRACIKRYRPLPKELFSYDWRDPFSARRGWFLWGVIGTFCGVAAVALAWTVTNIESFSTKFDILVHLQSAIGASATSTALMLAGAGIVAPVFEEIIFRGFLLTSLTKWVPTHVAVLVSAGVFSLAHFNPGKLPMMFALGVVLGFSYSKSGNLLTPIMIHGVWNTGMILLLTFLQHQGYDIQKLIQSQKLIRHRQPVVQTPDCAGKK